MIKKSKISRCRHLTWLIPLVIFAIAFSFRLINLNGQGETWDEFAYYDGGKVYLQNLRHGDFNSDHWRQNFEVPPVARWLYGAAIGTFSSFNVDQPPEEKFVYGRLLSALLGSLTVVLVYFFTLHLFRRDKIAFLAALILCFLPHFVAHNKIMALETPSAFFYTLAVYLFYLGLVRKPGYFLFSGLAVGLAIGTKLNDVHILLLMISAALIYYLTVRPQRPFSYLILLIPPLAAGLIFALWPWLWSNFWDHLNQNWRFLQTQIDCQRRGACLDWFLGADRIPPWYYYFYYFIATTPVLLLLLLIVYLIGMWRRVSFERIYLLLWFLTPFVMSFAGFKQDGIRYIFPVLVPLAIIAAVALFTFFPKKLSGIIAALVLVLYLVGSSLMVHPFYLDYYSEIVGGTKGVYQKKLFEIGWWGEGLETAYHYLNTNASPDAAVLSATLPDDYSRAELREDIRITKTEELPELDDDTEYDYLVSNTAFYWRRPLEQVIGKEFQNYQLEYEVKAAGAPIVSIYKKHPAF